MVLPGELIKFPEGQVLQLSQIVDITKNNYATSFETKVKLEELQKWLSMELDLYTKGLKNE